MITPKFRKKRFNADIKKKTSALDKRLLFLTLVIVFIGLLAVADASAPLAIRNFSDKFYFVKQQVVWAIAGIIAMLLFSQIPYKLWEKYASLLFFLSLSGLIFVFIPGIGIKVLGASRWIDLGLFSFQPSEFIKLSLGVYLAKVYSKEKSFLAMLLPVAMVAFLVMLQPDLGTTAVIVGFSMIQIFISGVSLMKFAGISLLGFISLILLIITSSYRKERLMTFLKLTQDPLDQGYHIRQILLALGSGGFWGVGLGLSRQKFLFLPETATDSIFAIIAEEVGFIGSFVLIFLFIIFVMRGISIAKKAPDKFSYLLAIGITSWIGVQIFLNISAMVALVPLTGIPLPFISYGGSSLFTILLATGILLNISKFAKEK